MSESDRGLLNVLVANYGNVEFLINRSQCSSSIFASGFTPIPSKHRYLDRLLEVDGDLYLLFDLDQYLRDTFRLNTAGTAQLAVLVDMTTFQPATAAFLQQKLLPQLEKWGPDQDRVAFLISSNTAVQEIEFSLLASHPPVLRQHLIRKGVATGGFRDDRILFLIDLEKLISSKQIFRKDTFSISGEKE